MPNGTGAQLLPRVGEHLAEVSNYLPNSGSTAIDKGRAS